MAWGHAPRSHVVLFVNTKHETELIRILFIYYCVWFYFSLCSGFNLSLACSSLDLDNNCQSPDGYFGNVVVGHW